jgi:hypothetical protein
VVEEKRPSLVVADRVTIRAPQKEEAKVIGERR